MPFEDVCIYDNRLDLPILTFEQDPCYPLFTGNPYQLIQDEIYPSLKYDGCIWQVPSIRGYATANLLPVRVVQPHKSRYEPSA